MALSTGDKWLEPKIVGLGVMILIFHVTAALIGLMEDVVGLFSLDGSASPG